MVALPARDSFPLRIAELAHTHAAVPVEVRLGRHPTIAVSTVRVPVQGHAVESAHDMLVGRAPSLVVDPGVTQDHRLVVHQV